MRVSGVSPARTTTHVFRGGRLQCATRARRHPGSALDRTAARGGRRMGGRRILITGGTGFVGAHLADHLLARGDKVRALDVLSPQLHEVLIESPVELSL